MAVAMVTSAYAMLAATSFVGMGSVVTKDSFEWLFSGPKIVKASEIICRLADDIVSHEVVIYGPFTPRIINFNIFSVILLLFFLSACFHSWSKREGMLPRASNVT